MKTKTVNFDGEKATLHLPYQHYCIPIREVRKQICMELGKHIRSFKLDGSITDETEVYEILCLVKALKLLPRR